MRELRLFKNSQGLGDVLAFQYCRQATSKLDPFLWQSVVKESYGELVERKVGSAGVVRSL
eukprot:11641718-Ditylum_brightwellii.AAC.1